MNIASPVVDIDSIVEQDAERVLGCIPEEVLQADDSLVSVRALQPQTVIVMSEDEVLDWCGW